MSVPNFSSSVKEFAISIDIFISRFSIGSAKSYSIKGISLSYCQGAGAALAGLSAVSKPAGGASLAVPSFI
jgi:hypothetical protein